MSKGLIEIAAYDMAKFPETQDESTELGQQIIANQFIVTKGLIAGAFQDVFHKNWEDSYMEDCQRISQNDRIIVMYKNRPFLELGEMQEEFGMKNGTPHLIINQIYKVL